MSSRVRPRLLAVWLLLPLLVGAIVVIESSGVFEPAPAERTAHLPMFTFTEPDLGAVEVLYQGRFAALMRDADGDWFVHDASHRHSAEGAPVDEDDEHVANPELAAKLTEQLAITARTIADRRITPTQSLDEYGLANPQIMILFYGRQGDEPDYSRPLYVLHVGDLLTNDFSYYTMRDGDTELSLVPRYYITLLLALIYGEDQVPAALPAWDRERASDI